MGYSLQKFKEFGPLSGEVNGSKFERLPEILHNARALLKGRSEEEILSAAANIEWIYKNFVDTAKENYYAEEESFINRAMETGDSPVFRYLHEDERNEDERNEDGIANLIRNWPSFADEPNPFTPETTIEDAEDVSLYRVLAKAIDEYVLNDDPEFPNGQDYEYFAVLALRHIAEANYWLTFKRDAYLAAVPKEIAEIINDHDPDAYGNSKIILIAGEAALEAMYVLSRAQLVKYGRDLKAEFAASVDKKLEEKISLQAAKAQKEKAAKDPKQKEKAFVKDCWNDWQKNLSSYESQAAFARDMLSKCEHLVSQAKIESWCREWKHDAVRKLTKRA